MLSDILRRALSVAGSCRATMTACAVLHTWCLVSLRGSYHRDGTHGCTAVKGSVPQEMPVACCSSVPTSFCGFNSVRAGPGRI